MASRAQRPARKVDVRVYDFLDYRAYLRAHYEAAKRTQRSFSFRSFAKLAGLRSPNFLKLVIEGDRNLGADSVPRFCVALGLEGPEAEFFADLVAFNQASSLAEKNRAFERISPSRRFRAARRIALVVRDAAIAAVARGVRGADVGGPEGSAYSLGACSGVIECTGTKA